MANQEKHSLVPARSTGLLAYNNWHLTVVAAIAGIGVGIVGGSFHLFLTEGRYLFSNWLLALRLENFLGAPGWIIAALISGVCVGMARWLVSFAPSAAGSGVQHVEAVMRKEATPAPLRVLPIKFFGGLLAIIPGMALGREGPTIQMAAVIGSQSGRIFRLSKEDNFLLYTAVAGAGLGVAFNAPIAAIAFVIEEVTHRITTRSLLIALISVATSITVFRSVFGNTIVFNVISFSAPDAIDLVIYAFFGASVGAIGALYNRNILLGLNLFSRIGPNFPVVIKAFLIGAAVGLIAYWHSNWVGGGEIQTQDVLSGKMGMGAILVLLLVRWVLGSLSYAPGLPGGLFAPLLLVGALLGVVFAELTSFLPYIPYQANPIAFALIGMTAFFTAVVRAPFTGVLLIIEMSGSIILSPALLIASACATLITIYLKSPPIYDSLRAQMLASK